MTETYKAPFITFEGGEGAGKSTQIQILAEYLRDLGISVETLREPGGTHGAEQIREVILKGQTDRWDPITEALLMSAARRDLLVKRVKPHLKEGTWVLCDRHFDSTTAYQGFGHMIGYDRIRELNHFTVGDFEPNLTLIIDIAPEIGIARTHDRTHGEDRYERMELEFHHRVQEGYEHILKDNPERCVALQGLQDIDELAADIKGVVKDRLQGFFENYHEVS